MCDRKDCPKAYHLLCLNLPQPPYGEPSLQALPDSISAHRARLRIRAVQSPVWSRGIGSVGKSKEQ